MLTLAAKHQQMIAYQIHSCSLKKSTLEVTSVSTLPVDVLNKEVVTVLRQKYPGINEVHLAKNVTNNGINYRTGMLISLGQLVGSQNLLNFFNLYCQKQFAFCCEGTFVCMVSKTF